MTPSISKRLASELSNAPVVPFSNVVTVEELPQL